MTIPTAEAVTSCNAVGIGVQEPPLRIEPKYAPLIPNRDVNQFTRNAAELMQIRIGVVFFFNDTATTEIYPLSLPDALPISLDLKAVAARRVEPAVLDLDGIRARRR